MTSQPTLIPRGHSAVMAGRQADDAGGDALDYFPTPPWAARAGGELIARLDPGKRWRTCWEPACGGLHMAWGLRDYFDAVLVSDIHEHARPDIASVDDLGLINFVNPDPDGLLPPGSVDWIVTNPPFRDGQAFVETALKYATRGVAMLLRLQFREGAARAGLFGPEAGFVGAACFTARVPMVKGRWDPEASSATAYAWFVWMKPQALDASPAGAAVRAAWAAGFSGLDMAIDADARKRLTRPSDFELFAPRPDEGPGLFNDAHQGRESHE